LVLRFIGVIVVAALVGGAIGYSDDHSLVEAAIFAAIGVAIAGAGGVKAFREKRAEDGTTAGAGLGRFMKWGIAGVTLLIAGVAAWIAWEASQDEAGFLWRDSQVEPEPVRSLKGIRLGEPLADVSARLGAFELEPPASGQADPARTRNYVQRASRIRLLVDQDRVARVSYECAEHDATRVNRIGCGARESRVIEVFGNGARRLCGKIAATEATAPQVFALDALDTGTRYVSIQGQVKGFVVMEPRELENALGGNLPWHRCS
jgi:hypothetical protein